MTFITLNALHHWGHETLHSAPALNANPIICGLLSCPPSVYVYIYIYIYIYKYIYTHSYTMEIANSIC